MKQNPKPFSVEIKKSRVQGQRNRLPPRRLFATAPAEATKTFLREEPQVGGAAIGCSTHPAEHCRAYVEQFGAR